jgi:hypothetical protein
MGEPTDAAAEAAGEATLESAAPPLSPLRMIDSIQHSAVMVAADDCRR